MRVLFFAQLKDVTGCETLELPARSPVNVQQLWEMLLGKFPALARHQKTIRLARNWEYVDGEAQFADHDEVALIPPVSGG